MSIYQTYCREEFDRDGRLTGIRFHHPDNFNFGYDVVDVIARETTEKQAVVWCSSEGAERTLCFREIAELSSRAANVFLQAGIRRAGVRRHGRAGSPAGPGHQGRRRAGPRLRSPDRELEKTLLEFTNARLAEYKWIRLIEFTETIPKTISGKICKAALRR